MSEPREGNWWSRNWKWVLPVGCLGAIVLVVAFVAAIVTVVFGAMRSSDVYSEALARAQASPAVVEAIGASIEPGYFMGGNISVNGPSGEAALSIPVSGPKGKATIFLEAKKSAGQWSFSLLEVKVADDGRRIDILRE